MISDTLQVSAQTMTSFSLTKIKFSRRVLTGLLLIAVSVMCCGCRTVMGYLNPGKASKTVSTKSDSKDVSSDKVATPPSVPGAPVAPPPQEDPSGAKIRLTFPDMITLEQQVLQVRQPDETTLRQVELLRAVEDAVKRGVIGQPQPPKPEVSDDSSDSDVSTAGDKLSETGKLTQKGKAAKKKFKKKKKKKPADTTPPAPLPLVNFEPDQQVTFGELYHWVVSYQNPPVSLALAINPALVRHDSLQEKMTSHGVDAHGDDIDVSLQADTPLTRETFCWAYVYITNQQNMAEHLRRDDVLAMNPVHNEVYALSEFQDFQQISPWAQKYVAVAYRDNVLKSLFGLTPGQMVNMKGFSPQQPVTRGEVLRFLYRFYAYH